MHPLEQTPIYELAELLETNPSDDTAIAIIEEFYNFFEVKEAENEMWAMLTIVIAADNEKTESHERSNALFFFEYFSRLNKAIYYLYKDKIEGTNEDEIDDDDDIEPETE